ncbi:MAG: cell division control protein 6, partial [Candidatus Methanomethylophilaceae archaeon]
KGSIDLIYQLSRFSEENINVSASVSLILISQEYVLDRLDDASLSTFKRTNAIRFNKYTRDELREIIATRVAEALVTGGMQEDAIDLIADISSEYGDARFAIDLLDKSARIGEEKSDGIVTAEEIRAAKAMIYSVVTESKLSNLDQNHMITLLAIARSIKAMSYVQSPAAEKTYAVVCEEYGVAARKHTQFWSYVQDLEKINLIVTKTISDSNTGGRTTLISLPDIPSKVLAKKVEEMME